MKFLALILLASLALSAATAQPAQIILIRHAEKTDNPDDLHLSPKGVKRALALVKFFTEDARVTSHGPPAALFAAAPSKHSRGLRAQETLMPLSDKLNIPIHTPYRSEDYAKLADEILHDPSYKDKTVAICWVHEYIPQFAASLGVKPEPPKWKERVFDLSYVITFPEGKPHLDNLAQRLLPGDSKHRD